MGKSRKERGQKSASFLEHVCQLLQTLQSDIEIIKSTVAANNSFQTFYPYEDAQDVHDISNKDFSLPPPAPPQLDIYDMNYLLRFRRQISDKRNDMDCVNSGEMLGLHCVPIEALRVHRSIDALDPSKSHPFQIHAAWSPDGLVHLRESEIIDSTRKTSHVDKYSASLEQSIDAAHDLTLAVTTAVPNDEYFDELFGSIYTEGFSSDFASEMQQAWDNELTLAEEMVKPDFIHRTYDSLMEFLRSICPGHEGLPENSPTRLPLNRGRLQKEFINIGQRIIARHRISHDDLLGYVPKQIPQTIHSREKFLEFHGLCMKFIHKYTPEGGYHNITPDLRNEFQNALIATGIYDCRCNAAFDRIDHIIQKHNGGHLTMMIINDIFAALFAVIKFEN